MDLSNHIKKMSSPPARGSPATAVDLDHCGLVVPARAGVARQVIRPARDQQRRPRPRGGRPGAGDGTLPAPPSSPPARGSPHGLTHLHRHHRVVPARAGVAPGPARPARLRPCRPRPRGGRPAGAEAVRSGAESSPPARGSPRGARRGVGQDLVVPARAGVAPPAPKTRRGTRRRPRPRGGRPIPQPGATKLGWSSPPARGSPRPAPHHRQRRGVVPARAGVAPPTPTTGPGRPCRPRPRGGRPFASIGSGTPMWSSPPARGSPEDLMADGWGDPVVPARAGVARPRATCPTWRWRRPRPRGGRPMSNHSLATRLASSPPARGSPRQQPARRRRGGVVPARAGVAPARPHPARRRHRRPRPRGGRPTSSVPC